MESVCIENQEVVIRHFSYWPSFHDAEILGISFDRNYKAGWPSISLKIYAFEMTNKKTGRYYKLVKHCLIELELHEVFSNEMDGFGHQNAVNGITFRQEEDLISCDIDPASGVGATIVARRVLIKSLLPLTTDPKAVG